MKAGVWVGKTILGLVVIGCIAISTFFAFEFGFAKAVDPRLQWAYGFAIGGLDLLKAALPIIGTLAWASRERIKAVACVGAFVFLTAMNLWAAWGITAGQLNERMGIKAAITSEQNLKQSRVDRLREEKANLPTYKPTTQSMVDAAKAAVATAEEQATLECGAGRGGRGRRCRAREQDVRDARQTLISVEQEFAVTTLAKDVSAHLRVAEADLATIDVKTASKDVNAQVADVANTFDISETLAAMIDHWFFAIGIEIGSGLGLWLLFGHVALARREEPAVAAVEPEIVEEVSPPVVEPMPVTQRTDISERDRFFSECLFPAPGNRVKHSVVFTAYIRWCYANEIRPMSKQAFGRRSPVAKEKIGGTIYYLECDLAPVAMPERQLTLVAG